MPAPRPIRRLRIVNLPMRLLRKRRRPPQLAEQPAEPADELELPDDEEPPEGDQEGRGEA